MNRIALLVHPFYCNVLADEMKVVYRKAMDEYDSVYVLSPSIHPALVSGLLMKYKDELIEYYITGVDSKIAVKNINTNISTVFRRDWFEWLVQELLALYNDMTVESDDFTELYGKFKSNADIIRKDMNDYLYDLIVKSYVNTIYTDGLKKNRQFTLFAGDLIPRHHSKLIDMIDTYFIDGNNTICNKPEHYHKYELGPIPFVIPALKGIFVDYTKEDLIIDVFGEYLNQCVNDVSDELTRLGYRNNVIANKSIYYSEDDVVYEPAYANVLSTLDDYDVDKLKETFKIIETEDKSFILIKAELKEFYTGTSVTVDSPFCEHEFDGMIIDVKLDTDNSILIVVEDQDSDVFDIPLEEVTHFHDD